MTFRYFRVLSVNPKLFHSISSVPRDASVPIAKRILESFLFDYVVRI
jgi:hypothetical protein